MLALVWGENAHLFKPEHFIDTDTYRWPRDGCAFPHSPRLHELILFLVLPFSAGARGCLGTKFATAESVCILAALVRRYEVLPFEDLGKDKSFEEYKQRLLKWMAALTITPTNAFVNLRPYCVD